MRQGRGKRRQVNGMGWGKGWRDGERNRGQNIQRELKSASDACFLALCKVNSYVFAAQSSLLLDSADRSTGGWLAAVYAVAIVQDACKGQL